MCHLYTDHISIIKIIMHFSTLARFSASFDIQTGYRNQYPTGYQIQYPPENLIWRISGYPRSDIQRVKAEYLVFDILGNPLDIWPSARCSAGYQILYQLWPDIRYLASGPSIPYHNVTQGTGVNPIRTGGWIPSPPSTVFCPLLNKSLDDPYLKFLDFWLRIPI